MKVDKLFVAIKAFILFENKILILRESKKYSDGTNTGRYDVVGGRVQPGERFDECLLREVKEETGLEVKIGKPFFVNEWRPNVRGEQWQVVGIFFECNVQSNKVVLSKDHDQYEWVDPKECKKYNLIPTTEQAFQSYLDRELTSH